jgi:HSP20 family protein
VKGVYGFSVKVGLGDKGAQEVKVEPFGNVRRDERSGETVVQEIREPVVDVFEEKDHTLVVAEMPGISTKDVKLTVKDDLLTIYAEKKDKKYRKEVLLPRSYPREKMKVSCNNGILEIKCVR